MKNVPLIILKYVCCLQALLRRARTDLVHTALCILTFLYLQLHLASQGVFLRWFILRGLLCLIFNCCVTFFCTASQLLIFIPTMTIFSEIDLFFFVYILLKALGFLTKRGAI